MALPPIAIGGRMQVGKTTCAEYLVRRHGYARYALADPIKAVARERFGWDGRKDERGRRLLQQIGTTGRAYDPRLWLTRFDAWLADHAGGPVVVDDVRLREEVAHLKGVGSFTVLIRRPRPEVEPAVAVRAEASGPPPGSPVQPPLDSHETETELDADDFDAAIVNQGTISDLYRKLEEVLALARRSGG